MKTPLALFNLTYQRAKTFVSVGGVAFALLLVFMQLGFMGAVSHTAVNVYEHMHFDILIRSPEYLHLYEPGTIERHWLQVAEGSPGVSQVLPLWITLQNWGSLKSGDPTSGTDLTSAKQAFGQFLPLAVMAIRPGDDVFDLPDMAAQMQNLTDFDSILVDSKTRSEYGPIDGKRFTERDRGRETEIGGQQVRIKGVFHLGTGLAANGAVLTGVRCFCRLVPWDCDRSVSLGLIRLSGSIPTPAAVEQLRLNLGITAPAEDQSQREDRTSSIQILTRDEVIAWERQRWLWQTPIGLIFQLGVMLSLLVGAAIVYMVLATDVMDRLPEYATLLAMGYSRVYLAGVVMTQAIVLACLGFLMAWIVSELLYRLTSWASGIPIAMNGQRVVVVAVLGLVMCCGSGLMAMNKLWKAEPASLF